MTGEPHAATAPERTSRGFLAPVNLAERTLHGDDVYIIVRISRHELRQLKPTTSGVAGRFCLLRDTRDESYELVRYADD